MKIKFIISVLLALSYTLTYAQQNFKIKGHLLELSKTAKIKLIYSIDNKDYVDSVITTDGYFTFIGRVAFPVKALLMKTPISENKEGIAENSGQYFYLENTEICVNGANSLSDAVIKGGKTQQDYLLLQMQLSALKSSSPHIGADFDKINDDFIYAHPNSYISLELIKQKALSRNDPEKIKAYYSTLDEQLRISKAGKDLMTILARNRIGQPFLNCSLQTKDGKLMEISSLKGKYVLIDLWASWCHWCREENPNILKSYDRLKDSNFEVLGISLDQNKVAWLKAVEEDSMPWMQVRDAKAFKGAIATHYNINAIPQNFLLNPQGIIIARNLRGEDLDKKLTELIKN